MSGGVPELACRKRLRSYDTKVKNKEKEEKKKMQSDDEEEDMKMWNSSDNKVENRKASTAILEKEKRRKIPINLSDDDEEEEIEVWDGGEKMKSKEEKRMRSGDDKVGNRKASTATFEKEKKKKIVSSHGGEKKMQSGDHDRDKKMSASLPLKQNNYFLKEKKKKMVSSEKKMHSVDHDKDNRRNMLVPFNKSKLYEKEKKKMLSSHNAEKKMCWDHHKDKRRSVPLPFDKNKMQKNEMKKSMPPITCAGKKKKQSSDCMETKMQNGDSKGKKKNTSPILSQENKIHKLSNKMENKRKERPMLFKKKKKMRADNKDNKEVGSNDRGKEKKIQGDKEQNMHSGGKEKKRGAPLAFFKVICKNFKESLFIPPTIASKFADLINRHVYLEDSEGKSSKIRLSVVDGSLAFHQGWDNFVLDHSIKYGDFILFEYTAMSKFSVRVFGVDSCERLCFNVERKGGKKKQKESHAPDDTDCNSEDINDRHYVSDGYLGSKGPKKKSDGYMNSCEIAPGNSVAKSMYAASGKRCITATTKEDPNGVVRGVECGPSMALDNKDAYLANGEHKAKKISQKCSKEETRESEIIIITDEAPLTQENEDTAKLTPLNAASGTRYVTANTKEDPKEVAGGAWCGPSVTLDNNEGNLAIGDCKTMSIYATCCKEKARKSEIIVITDAAPLAQENGDAVKLPTFSYHIEDTSMIKESEPEVASPTGCMEIRDSDQDLRRKQEGNTIQLKCATVVDKCPNNSKMHTNGNVFRKYEAPGGSRCLEKWKKDTVSSLATSVGTGITKPENSQKTDEKIVGNCGATGFNPFEQWLLGSNGSDSCVQPMPDKISKSGLIRTEINHSINGKGSTVQLQTKKEQLEPVGSRQRNNMCANHAVARQSEHHIFQQEVGKSSNHVMPVALLPVKVEVLELDDHAVLKTSLQFCIPSTTQTWLELPNSLSNAVRRKGRQDRNVIMLKDPMKRLWPVFYHENSVFVGFTRGWKPFIAANKLQIGDLCMLFKDLDEDEPVYHVQITQK